MVRKNNAAPALRNPTHGEVLIREFTNSNLTPKQLTQRAAPLLTDKELLRDVRALAPEDQTKFIDKAVRVRRDD